MVTQKTRDKIIDALMELCAKMPFQKIEMIDVADTAGIQLAQLHQAYDGKIAILEDFVARIDANVLQRLSQDMNEELARERLFDVLMHRFEVLLPYKLALKNIHAALVCDPIMMSFWNRIALTSQGWMLAAAGIKKEGVVGLLRTQGLVIMYARVFRVWLHDEDPEMARTMAELNSSLTSGERWMERACCFAKMMPSLPAMCRKRNNISSQNDSDAIHSSA